MRSSKPLSTPPVAWGSDMEALLLLPGVETWKHGAPQLMQCGVPGLAKHCAGSSCANRQIPASTRCQAIASEGGLPAWSLLATTASNSRMPGQSHRCRLLAVPTHAATDQSVLRCRTPLSGTTPALPTGPACAAPLIGARHALSPASNTY